MSEERLRMAPLTVRFILPQGGLEAASCDSVILRRKETMSAPPESRASPMPVLPGRQAGRRAMLASSIKTIFWLTAKRLARAPAYPRPVKPLEEPHGTEPYRP